MNNEKQMGISTIAYLQDTNGCLPPGSLDIYCTIIGHDHSGRIYVGRNPDFSSSWKTTSAYQQNEQRLVMITSGCLA